MLSISLGDILKTLDQFKNWKRINEAPDKVEALEKRVAALEARLAEPAKPRGEPCPICGAALKVTSERPDPTFGRLGHMQRFLECTGDGCGHKTQRKVDPSRL